MRRLKGLSMLAILALTGCGTVPGLGMGATTSEAVRALDLAFQRKPLQNLPAGSERPVSVYSYMAFDNDLADVGAHGVETYEKDVDPLRDQVLVHLDVPGDSNYRILIASDAKDGVNSPYMKLKQRNTASPAALGAFLNGTLRAYPGKRRVLEIADHGLGARGIANDDPRQKVMSLSGLGSAISQALHTNDVGRFNLVVATACTMASIETAYELKDTAGVLIASEDLMHGTPQDDLYTPMLRACEQTSASDSDVARKIVSASGGTEAIPTLSAIDLAKTGTVAQDLDKLARLLTPVAQDAAKRQTLLAAVNAAQAYGDMGCQVDVMDLADKLSAVQVPGLAALCKQLKSDGQQAVLASRVRSGDRGTGLTVFAPKPMVDSFGGKLPNARNLQKSAFMRETNWGMLVAAMQKTN